ncbi:hypothetical protein V8C42DRAFT_363790 [Trichoderma barbatum]
MQLTMPSNMIQPTSDHGGLYYTELIKSNLQFIYGKECLLEILSQVKAPDLWQVSVLKTEDGFRSVAFFDSGVGLLNVLEKLHRKSAEMLSKFISDNAADATAYVKRKKAAAAANATLAVSVKDEMQEIKEKRQDEDVTVKTVTIAPQKSHVLSMVNAGSDSDNSSDDVGEYTNRHRVPSNWRAKSPSHEIISIKSDDSLHSRSLICPNYGPASAFYRVSRHGPDMRNEMVLLGDRKDLEAAETNRPESVNSAPAPAPDAVKALAQLQLPNENVSATVRMQMENQMKRRQRNPAPPPRSNVLLFIQWPGYGETVVADECQLSVRSVQSRVRHMLRTHGPALFGKAKAITPIPFTPEELVNFIVTIKALSINDQVVVLGPNFGDDLTMVAKGLERCKSIKIEIELRWNGNNLTNPAIAAAN